MRLFVRLRIQPGVSKLERDCGEQQRKTLAEIQTGIELWKAVNLESPEKMPRLRIIFISDLLFLGYQNNPGWFDLLETIPENLPSNKRKVHAGWYSCTGHEFLLCFELHLCFHKPDLWYNYRTELLSAFETNPTGKVTVERATVFPMPLHNSRIAHTKSMVSGLNFSHDKFRQVTFI